MLRARDQVVLQIAGQFHKIRTVSGNADYEIAILFRLPLGSQQRFAIDDIKLNMPEMQIAPRADK